MPLTVGKLKEVIKDLPDDMPVGVAGWFGEINEFWFAPKVVDPAPTWPGPPRDKPTAALLFDHVDIGEEPD